MVSCRSKPKLYRQFQYFLNILADKEPCKKIIVVDPTLCKSANASADNVRPIVDENLLSDDGTHPVAVLLHGNSHLPSRKRKRARKSPNIPRDENSVVAELNSVSISSVYISSESSSSASRTLEGSPVKSLPFSPSQV